MLKDLKESLRDTPPAGPLVNICKTYDQAKAVAQFIEALAEKQLKYFFKISNMIFVHNFFSDHQHR